MLSHCLVNCRVLTRRFYTIATCWGVEITSACYALYVCCVCSDVCDGCCCSKWAVIVLDATTHDCRVNRCLISGLEMMLGVTYQSLVPLNTQPFTPNFRRQFPAIILLSLSRYLGMKYCIDITSTEPDWGMGGWACRLLRYQHYFIVTSYICFTITNSWRLIASGQI